MHSHVLQRRSDPRAAGIARRLGRRTGAIVATRWQARRPVTPWVSAETYPFDGDRVPGESYRDYLFRKGIESSVMFRNGA